MAGGGATPAGITGGGGPCPPGGPPEGEPGCIGGGVGEEGRDPPFRKDCRVDVSWSCMLVMLRADGLYRAAVIPE